MITRSRRILFSLTSLGLLTTIAVPVLAAESGTKTAKQDHHQIMIQALAQRFNLNQTDLQKFFNEQREKHMTDRLNVFLSEAVTKGRITEAQKIAIIAKAKEVAAKLPELQTLTPEQRAEKMKQLRTEIETWATQQGINKSFVKDILGKVGHHGPHGGMMQGKGGMRGPGGPGRR